MGKEMQIGTGKDNSILGETEGSHARANEKTKAAQKQKKKKSSSENDTVGSALARVISSTAADERWIDVLKFLFTNGNEKDKKKAYAGLSVYLNAKESIEKKVSDSEDDDDEEKMHSESNDKQSNMSRGSSTHR